MKCPPLPRRNGTFYVSPLKPPLLQRWCCETERWTYIRPNFHQHKTSNWRNLSMENQKYTKKQSMLRACKSLPYLSKISLTLSWHLYHCFIHHCDTILSQNPFPLLSNHTDRLPSVQPGIKRNKIKNTFSWAFLEVLKISSRKLSGFLEACFIQEFYSYLRHVQMSQPRLSGMIQ